MRKIIALLAVFVLFSGCSRAPQKYQTEFFDSFDTITTVTAYCKNESEFDKYAAAVHDEMLRLHRLFDIYNTYDGINNLKTVNDMAGIAPVVCEPELITLVTLGVSAFTETSGVVNIALGSVLRIWHDARIAASENPANAAVPSADALTKAAQHTDIGGVIIDVEAGTIFLADTETSLDVGSTAKGWAVERAAQLVRKAGLKSGIISAGGNIVAIGSPADGRKSWSVGIRNPKGGDMFDVASAVDISIVTSGGYERNFTSGGKTYHHIIDPETLIPAVDFDAVTVLHPDSAIADMLSTALFVLPPDEAREFAAQYSADALWIFADGSHTATDGYLSRSEHLGK